VGAFEQHLNEGDGIVKLLPKGRKDSSHESWLGVDDVVIRARHHAVENPHFWAEKRLHNSHPFSIPPENLEGVKENQSGTR
jgi:hypothetical protein